VKKVQEPTVRMTQTVEPTVRKTLTVATRRIHWRPLLGLVAAIVVMSVVVLCGEELKHVPPAAPSFTVLHSFAGPPSDGADPYDAGLIRDATGNLYGTTYHGGSSGCSNCGTVFKLSPDGTETTETILHSFTGGADGYYPLADFLVRDAAGNLYGTTVYGGPEDSGVVFKLSPSRTETVLHTFSGGADGAYPAAGLVRDAAGNLYGTTNQGGSATSTCNPPFGCGVVFELIRCDSEPSGYEFKVLQNFEGGADGALPQGRLLRDAAGNLYGTTQYGGGVSSSACTGYFLPGCGTVFKVSPTGTKTILYRFPGTLDGSFFPVAGLIEDAVGNLYGTTYGGVSLGCCGTVFKLSPTATETVLHSFSFDVFTGGGEHPAAGLIQDAAGNLYGTTYAGGASDAGVVFKLSPTGSETVLHTFTGGTDGGSPQAGLILDSSGNLYGTAALGGEFSAGCDTGCGVVFRLTP
jgi:uncharacterized repeat protein (TIGR03803 family)